MNLKLYINRLTEEVKSNIQNDFNINNVAFKNFSSFDYINFYLIYKYILNEDKEDFFISIPEDDYRPNFFASIFQSLVLIKLFQNYFYHNNHKPILRINDLVYGKIGKENRILIIKGVGPDTLRIHLKFPKKNENGAVNTLIPFKNQTKINPNLTNGRNTVKYIDTYKEFLNENFGVNFPFITDFSKRTLVISETTFFSENDSLPVNYTNKKGKNKNELPFFNYLIECCNDFNTAKSYLLDNEYTFDEIVVIGDTKYRECFIDILQECKWKGKVNNVIIIGTNEPSTEHTFKKWLWSNQEIRIANNENYKIISKEVVKFENLYNELINFSSLIDNYKTEFNINLSFVLRYLNFFYKIIVTDSNISKGIYQEYADRLLHYFSSDSFEEDLKNNFYKNDIYNHSQINECKESIIIHFKLIAAILQDRNPKWEVIVSKSRELQKFYLLVEKKSYDIIKNQLQKNRINNVVLVSDKRIDNKILYWDKCFNDEFNTENKIFVIPYLNNYDVLNRLYELKGKTIVLCYEYIDEIAFDKLIKKKLADEDSRITHCDRNSFIKTKYCLKEEPSKHNPLDSLFDLDVYLRDKSNTSNEELELPKDKILYDILFSDGSTEKFESTKGIFLIENNEQIKTTIGEIYVEAKIRFYQNNNPEVFKKILKIFDSEGLLKSFDSYSESWRITLKKLFINHNSIETLHSKIFDTSNKINLGTFKNYFDNNSSTRFPRIKVLNAIKNHCERIGLINELIVTDYDKFVVYSKKDHSIRQQAGRLLGSDLLDYIASNKTEKSDALKKLNDEIIEQLIDTIVEKVIKQKIISNEE
ncbi:hypothetical protein [Flavobacterium sp. LS1R10]|uniref:hypothetical protein n=1 Tax=Flavobacterium sp. LS1R10 TaxID=2497482 RepID=UPI000F817917|nr:hypothetical protein [Flavobacterium sp. LS1R10]RTY74788.1 hypothetical protein EKL96_08570 [Flavobacterium sp. LS1R10]